MIEINKIYCENCLDTMGRMDDNFIDLVVSSPPYDDLRKYNGYSFDFETIAKELYRVTKIGGVVVWIVGDSTSNGSESGTSFKQALYFKDIGFNLHDTMIYRKINYIPLTHNRYEQCFEYMFVLSKDKPKTFNPILERCVTGGIYYDKYKKSKAKEGAIRQRPIDFSTKNSKIKSNIWEYNIGQNTDNGSHPAPFPEQLAEDHIISWSNKEDLIYDPFTGSGTTQKMAIRNGRNFIGSEISKEYYDIAVERIKNIKEKTETSLASIIE